MAKIPLIFWLIFLDGKIKQKYHFLQDKLVSTQWISLQKYHFSGCGIFAKNHASKIPFSRVENGIFGHILNVLFLWVWS